MFSKVAITVLIFTLLLPWFTSAMGAFEHCPSCDKESCLLSAAECRHGKKHDMKMDKTEEEHASIVTPGMAESGHVKEVSVLSGKDRKQSKAAGCVIKADCAEKLGRSTLKPAEPHLVIRHNLSLTCLTFLSSTFFGLLEFKDPYPLAIDRPPASHPFYN